MNLTNLIDELRTNILNDRSDRIEDSESDYLWTDATLVRYIDEAQRRLAAEGFVIRDGTTALITQVTLVAGQTVYPLHNTVIAVMSARYDVDTYDLRRGGHSIFNNFRQNDEDGWDLAQSASLSPGRPIAFSTDEQVSADGDTDDTFQIVNLRVYPAPSTAEAGDVIYLRVCRLPQDRLNVDTPEMSPEVPELHHIPMLDWAASLALRIVDQDGGNATASERFAKKFEMYIKTARRTALRKMHAPVTWGFGKSGWSW